MIELAFDSLDGMGVDLPLGGDRVDDGFESFGFRFEAERRVDRGEAQLGFGGNVEVEAGRARFALSGHFN